MIKDIDKIRKDLEGYEQISLPYTFKRGCMVKYITFKNNEEQFNMGGEFVSYGDGSLILKKNYRTWQAPINILNKDGSIKHKNIFFVKEKQENEEECKTVNEFKDIIQHQQTIIEKMTKTITELEIQRKHLTQEKTDYEELLQQNRYNMKQICIESREKDETIEKYQDIIQKLANSHQMFHN